MSTGDNKLDVKNTQVKIAPSVSGRNVCCNWQMATQIEITGASLYTRRQYGVWSAAVRAFNKGSNNGIVVAGTSLAHQDIYK